MDAAGAAGALAPLALACVAAFAAAILGGLAGYGTGLVLPAFLVPVVGVGGVVPVMAVAMTLNNASRAFAFRDAIDWPVARRLLAVALPGALLGAWGYAQLPVHAVGLLLGGFLLAAVPLRRVLRARRRALSPAGQRVSGAAFGVLDGAMPGTGVVLVAILMGSGLGGAAVVATDAVISVSLGVAKTALFGRLDALDATRAAVGVAVGLCTAPGAFVARWLVRRLSARVHEAMMEAVIVGGALLVLWRSLG